MAWHLHPRGDYFDCDLIVVGSRDDFHVKDYASVIAAFVAVVGAVIPYQAAMAKIDEDRNRESRELDRKKLRLYLRLRFGLQRLSNHADAKDFIIDPPLNEDETKNSEILSSKLKDFGLMHDQKWRRRGKISTFAKSRGSRNRLVAKRTAVD